MVGSDQREDGGMTVDAAGRRRRFCGRRGQRRDHRWDGAGGGSGEFSGGLCGVEQVKEHAVEVFARGLVDKGEAWILLLQVKVAVFVLDQFDRQSVEEARVLEHQLVHGQLIEAQIGAREPVGNPDPCASVKAVGRTRHPQRDEALQGCATARSPVRLL